MNEKGGIFLGVILAIIFIFLGALYVAIIEPIISNVNDATGEVVGQDNYYEEDSAGNALIFAGPLLFVLAGIWALGRSTQS